MKKNKYEEAFERAYNIIEKSEHDFKTGFRSIVSVNNFYFKTENKDWSEGFHTGILWLIYEKTKNENLKNIIQWQLESFKERVEKNLYLETHDIGFLYSLSCVAGYKITNQEIYKNIALKAANKLIDRFQEKGNFIQAWGEMNAPDNYRLIIDCLMNLPLLYWATEESGIEIYKEKAIKHLKTTLEVVIRENNSTYHTFFFDQKTGEKLSGRTAQGYSDDSFWSRGQAWAIYGIALSYSYLKDDNLLKYFERVTEFFLDNLPKDYIPYWDLILTENDNEARDTSSAAIAVCGMLEMLKFYKGENKEKYLEYSYKIADELIERFSVKNLNESNGILKNGTYCKKSKYNSVNDDGVNECTLFGDYFYVEMLVRIIDKNWKKYW